MESLPLASSKSLAPCPPNPSQVPRRRPPPPPSCLPAPASGRTTSRRVRFRVSAHGRGSGRGPSLPSSENAGLKQVFASISSSSNTETSSIGTPQFPIPPPTPTIGSPLVWIGVGVGLSALFSWVTTNLKKYAMKRAMSTLMEQMASGNNELTGFSSTSPYPFPSVPFPAPAASSPVPGASQSVVTVDVPLAEVEATTFTEVRNDTDKASEAPKRYAFVDVSPEEISQKDLSINSNISGESSKEVSANGSAVNQDQSSSKEQSESRTAASAFSVDVLEKMMEDPTVQKMVYP